MSNTNADPRQRGGPDRKGRLFHTLLANKPFDILLNLLCVGLAYHVYTAKLFLAPVTSSAILAMVYAQLSRHYTTKSPTLDPSTMPYSFQPGAILEGKATRILTGQVLHYNKLHLLGTMMALSMLCSVEQNSSLPALGYFLFLAFMTSLVGVINVWIVKEFQPGDMYKSRIGFSGVALALEVFRNYKETELSPIFVPSFFLYWLSDVSPFLYDQVVSTPTPVLHVLELAVVSVFFRRIDFWGQLAGVAAGSLCALVEILAMEHVWDDGGHDTEGAAWTSVFVVVATMLLFQTILQGREAPRGQDAYDTR